MIGTKTHHCLSLLGKKERKRLREFLRSPFFNKREEPLLLLDFWEKHYAGPREAPDWSVELQAKNLLPEENHPDKAYQKLKTNLLNLVYQFLSHQSLEEDDYLKNLLQVKALNEYGDDRLIESRIKNAERSITRGTAKEGDKNFKRFELALQENLFYSRFPKRSRSPELYKLSQYLENGFFANAIWILFAMHNANRIFGTNFRWPFIARSWVFLVEQESRYPVVIRMYIHLYGLIHPAQAEHHFGALRKILKEHAAEISEEELRTAYTGALNHCTFKINHGESAFHAEYLSLGKEMIAEGLLLDEKGALSPWPFKNLITVALRLKEYGWITGFMNSHAGFIAETDRESAVLYNKGALHFSKGEFEEAGVAFRSLLQICEDIFYHLDARSYLLRIYYETQGALAMESLTHSFRMYIQRNRQISLDHKNTYLTFIAFFRRLINIPPKNRERIEILESDVLASDWNKAGKEWILEKLDELKK